MEKSRSNRIAFENAFKKGAREPPSPFVATSHDYCLEALVEGKESSGDPTELTCHQGGFSRRLVDFTRSIREGQEVHA